MKNYFEEISDKLKKQIEIEELHNLPPPANLIR